MSDKIISLSEARASGLRHYFTGKPCLHGHTGPRYVAGQGCVRCTIDNSRKWAKINAEKFRAAGAKHDAKRKLHSYDRVRAVNRVSCLNYRLKKYGLTHEQYEAMFAAQNNKCCTCKSGFIKTPHIDHCHTTGKVRGLLCNDCNIALGLVKDDVQTLARMIDYLKDASK